MTNPKTVQQRFRPMLASVLACGSLVFSTGCQMDIGGQTLPSPYYLEDDISYYAPGPEFKLANEAAAMKAQQAAEEETRDVE